MYQRLLTPKTLELSKHYPVVAITGPRQSGKTTLVRNAFAEKAYVSLEDPDVRGFASSDPRGFLSSYPEGCVLDEVQRVPDLLSYIQTRVDALGKEGLYVLTGSFHFGLMEGISQSLAGRVALLHLLPLAVAELVPTNEVPESLNDLLIQGLYPRVHDKGLDPQEWYGNYVDTYLERDVRTVTRVTDLARFQTFLRMCAGRSGHLVNLSSLGDDCGITHNTARSWLSVLQASFIVFLLQPHHRNFNKRLVKTPKLYFHDPGLLCYLLGIRDPGTLSLHPMRGQVFETWVISELLKGRYNRGLRENLYFWRDSAGHEVDCLVDQGDPLLPIEIKSGETLTGDSFKGLRFWHGLSGQPSGLGYLFYGGHLDQQRKEATVLGWRSFALTLPGQI